MNHRLKVTHKKTINFFIAVIIVTASFSVVNSAKAQPSVLEGSGDTVCTFASCTRDGSGNSTTIDACKQYCGDYQLDDATGVIVKVSEIILAVVGSLALIAFVIGGMMFLLSGGNQTMITRGKATIIGAVIGLFIVFFSYTVIKFITKDLLQGNSSDAPSVGL